LVIAPGIEIHAVGGTGDASEAMLAAAGATDHPPECGTWAFSFSVMTVQACTHFLDPSGVGFGGGGMNP
jgi:hypothetical protein